MLIHPKRPFPYFRVDVLLLLIFFLPGIGCKKTKVDVTAGFTYTKNCATGFCQVSFLNRSENADSYQWDFGDGQVSQETNPDHSYSQVKEYYVVSLKAISLSGSSHIKQDTVFLIERPQCENIGSFQCASKLQSGIPLKDKIGPNKNNNYYYFIMPAPGVAKIQFSPVPAGSYFYVEILGEARDNGPVIKSVYGYPGETILYYAGPLAADSFFVRVNPPSNAGSEVYDILYTFNGDDPHEINNNFSQATLLNLNVSKAGTILSGGDLDYFRFHLSQPVPVDINLSPVPNFPNNGYLTIDVYTEANSNSLIKTEHGYSGETIKFSVGPLDTGWYYLRLKANNTESPDKYNLTVIPDDKDPNEINNTFSAATTMQSNQNVPATIKASGDVDYYKFTATSNAPGVIDIDKVPIGINYLYVEVYNAPNSSARTDSKYAIEGNAINLITGQPFVAGQTYYFKVFSYYSQQSNEQYKIKVHQ